MRPEQNGWHFADDKFKHIPHKFLYIMIEILVEFVPTCPTGIISPLVQVMAWCREGDKPLPEPMMTHIYMPPGCQCINSHSKDQINSLVHDWSNSIANTLELLQSRTKPLIVMMLSEYYWISFIQSNF